MSTHRLAPGPRGHPLFGCMARIPPRPTGVLHEGRPQLRRGGTRPRFPGSDWVMVSDPDAVEHVLHANQENYRKPAVFTRLMGRLAGLGVLTSDGETWLRNRRLMQPAFHRQRIAAMVAVMADGVRQSADRLAEASRGGAAGRRALRDDPDEPGHRQPGPVRLRGERRVGRDREPSARRSRT